MVGSQYLYHSSGGESHQEAGFAAQLKRAVLVMAPVAKPGLVSLRLQREPIAWGRADTPVPAIPHTSS